VMGCTADSWRVADAWRRRLRTHRLAAPRPAHSSALADLENVSDESPRVSRRGGFLHRAHGHRPRLVRAGPAVSWTSTHRAFQYHRASDSGMDRSTDRRGLSGRHRAGNGCIMIETASTARASAGE